MAVQPANPRKPERGEAPEVPQPKPLTPDERRKEEENAALDEALDESFPASDPPAHTTR